MAHLLEEGGPSPHVGQASGKTPAMFRLASGEVAAENEPVVVRQYVAMASMDGSVQVPPMGGVQQTGGGGFAASPAATYISGQGGGATSTYKTSYLPVQGGQMTRSYSTTQHQSRPPTTVHSGTTAFASVGGQGGSSTTYSYPPTTTANAKTISVTTSGASPWTGGTTTTTVAPSHLPTTTTYQTQATPTQANGYIRGVERTASPASAYTFTGGHGGQHHMQHGGQHQHHMQHGAVYGTNSTTTTPSSKGYRGTGYSGFESQHVRDKMSELMLPKGSYVSGSAVREQNDGFLKHITPPYDPTTLPTTIGEPRVRTLQKTRRGCCGC